MASSEREVTDPITHLPIRIHDASDVELEKIPPPPSLTKPPHDRRDDSRPPRPPEKDIGGLVDEMLKNEKYWWDDPLGDQSRARVQTAFVAAASAGIGAFLGLTSYGIIGALLGRRRGIFGGFMDMVFAMVGSTVLALIVGACSLSFHMFQDKKPRRDHARPIKDPFQDPHAFKGDRDLNRLAPDPESAIWLNSFLKSVWPLINPAMFTAVCDMVEDSLQASMPALIHGVKVADIGQGAEPVRILSIRCLDKGEAAKGGDEFEAEEGDFINMEVALGYRAKDTSGLKGLRARSANLHIMMEFWLAGGGLKLPVWVELEGILAVVRMRIQLMSNPPFLSLMTMTLMGAPKMRMKCTPLAKGFLNVMDIPGLNGWILSTIDATIKDMLVAPKSMNVDLKAVLMCEPPKDTLAVGVIVITVRNAVMQFKNEKQDAYVTLGWSKLGKPVWSTRIISDSVAPVWEETTFLLVGDAELNIQEALKLELWDSDRFTADDLLGKVEVPLSSLMHHPSTYNNITRREDRLVTAKGKPTGVEMVLTWEVGYYAKTTLEEHRLPSEGQATDVEAIRADVHRDSKAKLKEAMRVVEIEEEQKDGSEDIESLKAELKQQEGEDFKAREDEIITSRAPPSKWCSGILSISIEQISSLEVQHIRQSGVRGEEEMVGGKDDEKDGEDDLPSAYCTVVINQRKTYRTRTKMKDDNPYFGAQTEKFIRDWRNTTVIIAVHDNRLHELHPILGVVVLPLSEIFQRRNSSIFEEQMPIMGGIGYGRMKLRLLWRSVKLSLPQRLRGWDVGTVEVFSGVKVHSDTQGAEQIRQMLDGCKMMFRIGTGAGAITGKARGKMFPQHEGEGGRGYHLRTQHGEDIEWASSERRPVRLPVKGRYASSLVVEFYKAGQMGAGQTVAFATCWLKDVVDDEEMVVAAPIYSYRMRRERQASLGTKEKEGVKYAGMNAAAPTEERVKGVHGRPEPSELASAETRRGELVQEGDPHEVIGQVELRMCFHSGLSGYHHAIATKDKAMDDVMKILDCVQRTHGAGTDVIRDTRESTDGCSADDDSDGLDQHGESDEEEEVPGQPGAWAASTTTSPQLEERAAGGDQSDEGDGKRKSGIVGSIKEFRHHHSELNKRHRGLMQWKAARNAVWAGHTVQEKGQAIGGRIARPFVGHRERQFAIESEV